MSEIAFAWRYCDHCAQTCLFEVVLERGFSDYEIAHCPDCQANLGEIRADMGHRFLGKKAINIGNGSSQGSIPQELSSLVTNKHKKGKGNS